MPDTPHDDAPTLPDLAAIRSAASRIAPFVHRTPVLSCRSLDAEVGATLYFKCESFQKIGAFKARGATNAVFALADSAAAKGVVTHSSGNHGAALAYAARARGIPAWIVMPENAPRVKQENVRRFGATIRFCAPTIAAREETCARSAPRDRSDSRPSVRQRRRDRRPGNRSARAARRRAGSRHRHRAGRRRRTAVGNGHRRARASSRFAGLRRGARERRRRGEEPSLGPSRAARPTATIADGLRTTLSARTLTAIRTNVAAIGTASEEAIVRAMRMTWERMKIVIEPSAAVPLACLLERSLDVAGTRVGIVVSGGNVDLDRLPWQS